MITYNCTAVTEKLMPVGMDFEEEEEQSPLLDPDAIYQVYTKVLPTLLHIGLLGNLLNVIVFTHHRMKMPSGFHLTLLAIALVDSGVLICAILDVVQRSKDFNVDEFSFANKVCDLVKYPLQNFFKHSSIWLLILSAFMRFIGVRYPFQAACWFNKNRTSIGIVFILFFCALCNVPRVFETELFVCPVEEEDTYFTIMTETDIGKSFAYKNLFPWFSSIVFFLVPFTLLSVFNLILLVDIWKQKGIRHKLSNRKSLTTSQMTNTKIQVNERQITTMIVVVIILFLLLESPIAVLDILHEGSVRISSANIRKGVLEIANMISLANCTVNFFIYLIFSHQFRQALMAVFSIKCNRKGSQSTSTNPISHSSRLPSDEASRHSNRKESCEYEKLEQKPDEKISSVSTV